jgi:hypothetical protein
VFVFVFVFDDFVIVRVSLYVTVYEPVAKRLIRLGVDEIALFGNHTEQVIEARNDQDADHGAQEHSADCCRADGAVSDRSGAGRNYQWEETCDEGEGGHQNGPEA